MSRTTNQYSHRFVGVAHGVGAMGWLRLVGSIKYQVSFAEYSLLYRALLQKRPNQYSHRFVGAAHDVGAII